jgi:hypothetical protein
VAQPQSRNRRRRGGGGGGAKPKPLALWRPVPPLAEPAPIVSVGDPTAVLHSLGDPPLQGQGAVAEHYMAAVIQRAAGLATALAATAGLLATEAGPDADDVEDEDADADEDVT